MGGLAPPPRGPGFPLENSVMKINPATGRVVARIRIPVPASLAVGDGMVWVGGAGQVFRIDPALNRVTGTVRVGERNEEPRVAYGNSSLYAAVGNASTEPPSTHVVRIDPRRLRDTDALSIDGYDGSPATTPGALWLSFVGTGAGRGQLVRLDPKTLVAQGPRFDVASPGGHQEAIALDDSSVWIAGPQGVARIAVDGSTLGKAPDEANAVASGPAGVWAALRDSLVEFTPPR